MKIPLILWIGLAVLFYGIIHLSVWMHTHPKEMAEIRAKNKSTGDSGSTDAFWGIFM